MNLKNKIIKKFKINGLDKYKIKYYKTGSRQKYHKTGEEECWVYPAYGCREFATRGGKKIKTNGKLITEAYLQDDFYMEIIIDEIKHENTLIF